MVGYLYVTDAPYYNLTDQEGRTQLLNIPVGNYNVRLWYPLMAASEEIIQQKIVVGGTKNDTASFQLTLKPELRPRRAPLPIQQGY